MESILQAILASEGAVLLDGAMGTLLIAAGMEQGESPEIWNIREPDQVRAIHREYIQAGARVLLTNSFGGTRIRLASNGLEERASELNQAAAVLAKQEASRAPQPVLVAGSIGPTGELLAPYGILSEAKAHDAFAEQAAALEAGGADLLWIETMSDLAEVKAAVEGSRSVSRLPVAVTMTFDTHGRTMMGVTPEDAMQALAGYDLIAMGANCGNGPQEIESVVAAMHAAAPDTLLIAKSNAGIPHLVDGEVVYDGTPEVMAEYAMRARAAGARLIGGCCGSTPEHIRAMAAALAGGETVAT